MPPLLTARDERAHTVRAMLRLRRSSVLVLSLVMLACSPNSTSCKPCKSGLTFVLDRIAGSLSRGTTADITICVDGHCTPETVTRDAASHSVFVPVDGIGGGGEHTITVMSKDGPVLNGKYNGKISVVDDRPGGNSCTSGCKLGVVRVNDDGTPVPGVPPTATTTSVAAAGQTSTTTAGG